VADVAVITDSTAYLPAGLVDSLDVTAISLYYDVGGGALLESEFADRWFVNHTYTHEDAQRLVDRLSAVLDARPRSYRR
jgi:fatty acid-binding protein DegV